MTGFEGSELMWIMSRYEDDGFGATVWLAKGAPYISFGQEPGRLSCCHRSAFSSA